MLLLLFLYSAYGRVYAALHTERPPTQGRRIISSCPIPRARDPGLHRPPSLSLNLNSSWQPTCHHVSHKNVDADVDSESDAMRARSQETTLKRRTPRHQPAQETVKLAGPKAKPIDELLSQHLSKQIVHVCTPHKALLWKVRHVSCSPRSRLRPRQTVAHGDRHGQPISP